MTLSQIEIPDELERALRERAAAERKSVGAVVVDVLARELGVERQPPAAKRDLSDIAGSGGIDDEIEAFLWEQRRIDPEMWQ